MKTSEKLEVKMILSEELLDQNPELKEIYSNGIVTIPTNNYMTIEFKDELKKSLELFSPKGVSALQPVLSRIAKLHEFRDVKFDPSDVKGSDKSYKEIKAYIGNFNTTQKKAKDEIIKPAREVVNQINSFFKLVELEYTTSRNVLEENFKELIEMKEREKEEKERKKKEAELKEIERLAKENEELQLKENERIKERFILTTKSDIAEKSSSVMSSLATLNLDGLKELKENISKQDFNSAFGQREGANLISREELDQLKMFFDNTMTQLMSLVDTKINEINTFNENQEIKQKLEIANIEAEKNKADDLPFQVQEKEEEPHPFIVGDDTSNFERMTYLVKSTNEAVQKNFEKIKELDFKDEMALDVYQKIINAFNSIQDMTGKTDSWVEQKLNNFKNK